MSHIFSRIRNIIFKKDISNALKLSALFCAIGVVLLVSYLSAHSRTDRTVEKTCFAMGTIVEIKVPLAEDSARGSVEADIDKAVEELRRVEGLFSAYIEGSEVSKINRLKKGEDLKIDGEVFRLIEKSVDLSGKTYGAFDITVKPLVDLWAKARSSGKLPSDDSVKAAKERSGCANIILNKTAGTIKFAKDGMAIDMGAIAKGYATDMAIKALKDGGVKDAIVNCGGDMYCLGGRSPGASWKVGIRDPRNRSGIFLELKLRDMAVDTSGDYEKFFIVDGRRYSHIIDPRTGYPVGDDTISASVIAGDSATADALATALCVLGRRGVGVIERIGGAGAVIVFNDRGSFKTFMSRDLKERFDAVEVAGLR